MQLNAHLQSRNRSDVDRLVPEPSNHCGVVFLQWIHRPVVIHKALSPFHNSGAEYIRRNRMPMALALVNWQNKGRSRSDQISRAAKKTDVRMVRKFEGGAGLSCYTDLKTHLRIRLPRCLRQHLASAAFHKNLHSIAKEDQQMQFHVQDNHVWSTD